MSLGLRAAVLADVEAIVDLKSQLRMHADGDGATSSRGGFLLGAAPEGYAALIADGRTQVLVDGGRVVGFAAGLGDAALRASPLWQRRGQIAGAVPPTALEALTIGYLDQLAVLPDPKYRPCAAALAYHAIAGLFAEGCALVVTTVVSRPVRNLASRGLLAAAGALQIGTLDEDYPGVGTITSDVFALRAAALDPSAQDDASRRLRLHRLAAAVRRLTDETRSQAAV